MWSSAACSSRLTPARAGNTPPPAASGSTPEAHPRTGGEHGSAPTDASMMRGSPPHGRGTRQRPHGRQHDARLTPARAGNTDRRRPRRTSCTAHPRTGGEHGDERAAGVLQCGSPPHGRGTRSLRLAHRPGSGLTPARAGNTTTSASTRTSPSAHPRTGGEHLRGHRLSPSVDGSPPHGRGTHDRAPRLPGTSGLTPARAGNTSRGAVTEAPAAAHPRTGGEHASSSTSPSSGRGSPPHGRGTRPRRAGRLHGLWLTPARAGNTVSRLLAAITTRAHPRTGGEHALLDADRRHPARLTPARAGNTTPGSTAPSPPWAHPRTGGEHRVMAHGIQVPNGSPPHGRGTL